MTKGRAIFGGEPLIQCKYIHIVCKRMNPEWNRRVETSLDVPWKNIEVLLNDIDEWIIDIKDMNKKIYETYTGVKNDLVIQNLLKMKERILKERFHIRIPNTPGYNTKEDVDISVQWTRSNLDIESEVFDYYELKSSK